MRKTMVTVLVTAALFGAATASAQAQDWIYTIPDYKGIRWETGTVNIDTWIGIDEEVWWDGRIRIGVEDKIEVEVKYPVPVFVPTYIKLSSTQANPFNPATDNIVLTDIYAKDLQPDLDRNQIPFLTGFNPDPAFTEIVNPGPERFRGRSGTWYTADTIATTIGQLPLLLPGYDLSKFSTDPDQQNTIVYVAQTTVPAHDFIGLSSAWVGDVNNHWTEAGNWSPSGDPNDPAHRVVFGWDAFPTLNPTVQLDVNRTVGQIEFYPGANTAIQGSATLTYQYDGLSRLVNHGGNHRIGVNFVAPQGLAINSGSADGSTAQWPLLTFAGPAAITGNLDLTGTGDVTIAGLATVTGTTTVNPGSTLTVANGGWLFTDTWVNPGKDVVTWGGRADISRDLQVAGTGTFDIAGTAVVGDTTTVEPGATLTVQPDGWFQTRRWVNPGTDIVRPGGTAIVLEDLLVSGTGTFQAGGQVSVGLTTTVEPGATLEIPIGGTFTTRNWVNEGRDIVRGLGSVGQDLVVGNPTGTPGFFDVFGTADVAGTTTVLPGATLTVQSGGVFTTNVWRNPGTDIVLAGGRATVLTDLTVGDPSGIASFFDVFGELTVGGTTTNLPGGVFTVQPGGVFITGNWKNPGRDIVRGTATVTQDLEVGDPTNWAVDSFFDIFTELSVGGTTTVYPGGTLTVQEGGQFTTGGFRGGGAIAVDEGDVTVTHKPASWTGDPAAVQEIGTLTLGASGNMDVKNNLVNVNYGAGPSPYAALAAKVNGGGIGQSTGKRDRTVGIYDTALDLDGATPEGRTVRVGYAAPGDTMMRGRVDSSDIINFLSADKFNKGPSDAKWHEGDFTHDLQVDSDDVISLLSADLYDRGPYDADVGEAGMVHANSLIGGPLSSGRATVIYDAVTGDVKIDPNGNTMTSLRLKDSAGSFFLGSASFPAGAFLTTDTGSEKFWSTLSAGSYLTSVWDLGTIAPTGLSEAAFMGALNNLAADSVWTKAGGGTFGYNMQYVPEPSSIALLAVMFCAGPWMWLRRLKRAQ